MIIENCFCLDANAVKKYNVDSASSNSGLEAPYSSNFPKERKLRLASSICNTELLNRLLETGVNPDAADEHLRSSLHLAASRGDLSLHSFVYIIVDGMAVIYVSYRSQKVY